MEGNSMLDRDSLVYGHMNHYQTVSGYTILLIMNQQTISPWQKYQKKTSKKTSTTIIWEYLRHVCAGTYRDLDPDLRLDPALGTFNILLFGSTQTEEETASRPSSDRSFRDVDPQVGRFHSQKWKWQFLSSATCVSPLLKQRGANPFHQLDCKKCTITSFLLSVKQTVPSQNGSNEDYSMNNHLQQQMLTKNQTVRMWINTAKVVQELKQNVTPIIWCLAVTPLT